MHNIVVGFHNLFVPHASMISLYTKFRCPKASVEQKYTKIVYYDSHREQISDEKYQV